MIALLWIADRRDTLILPNVSSALMLTVTLSFGAGNLLAVYFWWWAQGAAIRSDDTDEHDRGADGDGFDVVDEGTACSCLIHVRAAALCCWYSPHAALILLLTFVSELSVSHSRREYAVRTSP